MAVDRTETFREVDSLIDHDTIRHLDVIPEFEGADEQYGALYGIQLLQRPVRERGYFEFQRFSMLENPGQPLVEHALLSSSVGRLRVKLLEKLSGIVPGDLVLVERLNEQLSRPGSCAA